MEQHQHNQNDLQVFQEAYQAPKKSFIPFYIIGGVIVIVALVAGAIFAFSKGEFKLDSIVATGFSCPLNKTVLQACSYKLRASENPDFHIPPEVEELTRGVTCPQTEEQLNACMTGKIDSDKPSTVDLQVKVNGTGPFDSTQDVSSGDEVRLLWESTNASFCTLNQQQVSATGTKQLFGQLKAGEEVTQEIQCGDATDNITLNVGHYKLTDFEKAINRWVDRFDTSNIPTDSFKAFYFNSIEPNKILKTEIVPKVAIDYSWSDVPGLTLDPKNFGGYWIGKIHINTSGVHSVTATQGHSDVRVIIDGYEIPIGSGLKIDLTEGTHQVEVEYLNNWHTVDFLMTLEPEKKMYSLNEVKEIVDIESNSYDVWYVGSYNEDPILEISSRAKKPTILVLESYEPNQWVIKNAKANNIAYIIYGSSEPGASLSSDLSNEKILLVNRDVVPDPDGHGAADVEARCWTDNYPPRCDNVYTISNLNKFAKENFRGELTGFTGLSDSDERFESVTIPRIVLTASKIAEIQNTNNDLKSDAEAKAKKEGASVETLFPN